MKLLCISFFGLVKLLALGLYTDFEDADTNRSVEDQPCVR
jgi:hypothetical protein